MNLKKAVEILTEFLDSEINDSGLSYTYDLYENEEDYYYVFEVIVIQDKDENRIKSIYFKAEDAKLFVEASEDCWEEIKAYDWTVKYFWMAFLKWPF